MDTNDNTTVQRLDELNQGISDRKQELVTALVDHHGLTLLEARTKADSIIRSLTDTIELLHSTPDALAQAQQFAEDIQPFSELLAERLAQA